MVSGSDHFKSRQKSNAVIFKLLTQCVRKYGDDGLIKILKSHISGHHFSEEKTKLITNYIIDCTATEYEQHGVTKETILNSSRRGAHSEARKICFILIKKNIKISSHKLINYFGKNSIEIVNRAVRDHVKIDRNSKAKAEQEFIKRYDAINKKVLDFITELKNKQQQ